MPAKPGRDLLLKLDPAEVGSYQTMAGLRARRIALSADAVDVTDADSPGRWRQLLGGAGVRRASLSGTGVFKDVASDSSVRQLFFDGSIRSWEIVIPDFGTVTGPFLVTRLDYAGTHEGEVVYEMALESAGALTFAPSTGV